MATPFRKWRKEMPQAILTKSLPPKNARGWRVKAKAAAGSITIDWDENLDPRENHSAAAKAFCAKMQWPGVYAMGQLHDGNMVHVLCEMLPVVKEE